MSRDTQKCRLAAKLIVDTGTCIKVRLRRGLFPDWFFLTWDIDFRCALKAIGFGETRDYRPSTTYLAVRWDYVLLSTVLSSPVSLQEASGMP